MNSKSNHFTVYLFLPDLHIAVCTSRRCQAVIRLVIGNLLAFHCKFSELRLISQNTFYCSICCEKKICAYFFPSSFLHFEHFLSFYQHFNLIPIILPAVLLGLYRSNTCDRMNFYQLFFCCWLIFYRTMMLIDLKLRNE